MANLYQLTNDFKQLLECEDDETTSALIEIAAGEVEVKAEGYCKFLAVLESEIEQFKAEEKRIAAAREAMENKLARAKDYMKDALLAANIDKLSVGTFKISIAMTAGTLVIDDEKAVPSRYLTVIPEQYIPDKAAIKAAIKNGEACDYAHIEAGFSLRIK